MRFDLTLDKRTFCWSQIRKQILPFRDYDLSFGIFIEFKSYLCTVFDYDLVRTVDLILLGYPSSMYLRRWAI